MMDNLQDLYTRKSQDFIFSYHNALRELFEKYLKILQLPVTHYYKFYDYLTSEKSRKKYLQDKFPDNEFSNLMTLAITENNKKQCLIYMKN